MTDRLRMPFTPLRKVLGGLEAWTWPGATMGRRYPALFPVAWAQAAGWMRALRGQDESRTITGGEGTTRVAGACLHCWEGTCHGTPG